MGFLSEYDLLTSPVDQLALMGKWIVENPSAMFAELRAQKPIFITPGPVIVSRYWDVLAVASLDQIYSVKPYGVAMMRNNGGPNFILGMDDGPEFENDLAIPHLAVKRTDLDRIREIVAACASQAVNQARDAGTLNLTQSYSRLVPSQFVAEYFGVPGPDSATLMGWVRAMFTDIFLNFTQNPEVTAVGEKAGVQFRAYLDELIASIQKNGTADDNVIGRLITMQSDPAASFTNSRIRDNLIGCVTGVLENTNTAVVTILDFLFDHPNQMIGARAAARAGDNDLLLRYVLETLRFHTPAPILVRLAVADHVLARGTPFETVIPAGKLVFASNGSAMMDETELDHPLEFRLNRPSHHYLHFGWGIHQCLGKYISQVQIVEMIRALLLLPGLRRTSGAAGQLTYAGPFPGSFAVDFDPASSLSSGAPKGKVVQNPLTLIMKIKSDADYQQLYVLLQHIQSAPPNQNPIWGALDKLANVHFARFAFLENNTRLAVITVYDGTFDAYINEFIDAIGDVFNGLLTHMAEAPPLPVQQHRAEFLAYVKANDFRGIEPFYSAYPTATALNAKAVLSQG